MSSDEERHVGPLPHGAKEQIAKKLAAYIHEQGGAADVAMEYAKPQRPPHPEDRDGRLDRVVSQIEQCVRNVHSITINLDHSSGQLLGKRTASGDGGAVAPEKPVATLDKLDDAVNRLDMAIDRLHGAALFLEEL